MRNSVQQPTAMNQREQAIATIREALDNIELRVRDAERTLEDSDWWMKDMREYRASALSAPLIQVGSEVDRDEYVCTSTRSRVREVVATRNGGAVRGCAALAVS